MPSKTQAPSTTSAPLCAGASSAPTTTTLAGDLNSSVKDASPDPRWPYLSRWSGKHTLAATIEEIERSAKKSTPPPVLQVEPVKISEIVESEHAEAPPAVREQPPAALESLPEILPLLEKDLEKKETVAAALHQPPEDTSPLEKVVPKEIAAVTGLDSGLSNNKPVVVLVSSTAADNLIEPAAVELSMPLPTETLHHSNASQDFVDTLDASVLGKVSTQVPSTLPVGNPPDGNRTSSQPPPLKGAWTKKLKFLPTSALNHSQQTRGQHAVSKPVTAKDDLRFPWAAKMNPSSRNLYRAVEPEYLEDKTPKVTIPPHVLLEGLENQKEYVLGQFFRCSPPPGGLIYAVFNNLWGRKCKISIRKLGVSSYLFHIPEESTRNWVLQRGLWHVDDCLMFVAPWIPEASLAIPEIKTIPVWVTLKNIPSILYSIRGISHIASGLGAPMATHKPRLDPFFMGEAKILVEVELSKAFPPRIAADDKNGVIWMVDVEYAWLPSTCSRCGQLGHKVKRCLQSGESLVVEEANETHSNVLDTTIAVAKTTPRLVPTNSTTPPPNEYPSSDPVFKAIDTPAAPTIAHDLESSPLSAPSGARSYSEVVLQDLPTPPESLLAPSTTIVSTPQSTTHPTIISEEAIESPTLGAATPLTVTTDIIAQEKPTVHLERVSLIEPDLGSNRFASLGSPEEEEDSSDSDQASESADPLTPAGKRILRDRPVKPSAKAKEMDWQTTARGRGHRGRGRRG